jgi:steroid delta-isomerase-like uncharacterized protein
MSEENKAMVRRYVEQIWNERRLDLYEEFIAPDLVPHIAAPVSDAEGMKQRMGMLQNAFPDLRLTIEDEIVVDDKVIQRWRSTGTQQGEFAGIPATGKAIDNWGISIYRLAGGKIVEVWSASDNLVMMQQIGAVPKPEG